MTQATLIMAYYENPKMLQVQYDHIRALPESIRKFISVIIVDDGSPKFPAVPPDKDLGIVDLQIYRMGVDVRWNQDACRNIGVRHAKTEWVLLTDMDHLVPADTWNEVLWIKITNPDQYYWMFPRVSAPDMSDYKHHPNTWFMTRTLYDKMGGYDERFAGIYGTDGDFARRLRPHAQLQWFATPIIRVPSTEVADAATTAYDRKTPADYEGRERVNRERAQIPNWKSLRYSFPYSRVYPT